MSNADVFLKKALGEDFFESLSKVEIWKPGTKSVVDHEEIRTALQIVPRTVIALLIKELVPMAIGETKEISLFVGKNALIRATKLERDVYSGDIEDDNKKVTEFKLRALPGVGLVIMSAFELYDMDNLINSQAAAPAPAPEAELMAGADLKVQHLIDERLALHDLVGKVIDKKIMEKDAIHQMMLAKLTEKLQETLQIANMAGHNAILAEHAANVASAKAEMAEVKAEVAKTIAEKAAKKKRPLQSFLEQKKQFSIPLHMTKGERIDCPDCGKNIFEGTVFSGCICLGDDRNRKIFVKKNENGVHVRFARGWDPENIEMLLEVLKKNK